MKRVIVIMLVILFCGFVYQPAKSQKSQNTQPTLPPPVTPTSTETLIIPPHPTNQSDCFEPEPQSRKTIKFEISLAGWADGWDKTYIEGKEISIRGVFTNVSKKQQELILDDHHDYHGTLDFPLGFYTKVINAAGRVLTENEGFCDGWWKSDCPGGSLSYLMPGVDLQPGDIITLKPSEKVTRKFPLNRVLEKCFASPESEDLVAGDYKVRFRLYDIYSNELKIIVKKETK